MIVFEITTTGLLLFRSHDAPAEPFDYLVAPPPSGFSAFVELNQGLGVARLMAGTRRLYKLQWMPGASLDEFRDTCYLELIDAHWRG